MSTSRFFQSLLAFVLICCAASIGCESSDPIVKYTIPTAVPDPFRTGRERMLAAMVPTDKQVWFFKVSGPDEAIEAIEAPFRGFVQQIEISDGKPVIGELPPGWRRGGDKPMRFASIDVDTPTKQLDISISQLGRQADWDEMVKMNVNRWRGQLGLAASNEKWAGGQTMRVAAADGESIWVDLISEPTSRRPALALPEVGGAPFAGAPAMDAPTAPPSSQPSRSTDIPADPRLKYDRPDGWRDGRMSSMRMAAFEVGSADAPAELTVIPAGGDVRGNVARWLGQVRGADPPGEVVDEAMANAKNVKVSGRDGQRFFLTNEDEPTGTAIDATIVPMDAGMSLFIKMTGPAETVASQSDAIASFLESLQLKI